MQPLASGSSKGKDTPALRRSRSLRPRDIPIQTNLGVVSIVRRAGMEFPQVDHRTVDDVGAPALGFAHLADFGQRIVLTGFASCAANSAQCRSRAPFWLILRAGAEPRLVRSSGSATADASREVVALSSGIHVDLGIWDGIRRSALLTSGGEPWLVRLPEPRTRLDRTQCQLALRALESCAAVRGCGSFATIAQRIPSQRANAVRQLFHETTGLNADGFRSVCVAQLPARSDTDAAPSCSSGFAVGQTAGSGTASCYEAMARHRAACRRLLSRPATASASECECREHGRATPRSCTDSAAIGNTNSRLTAQSVTVTRRCPCQRRASAWYACDRCGSCQRSRRAMRRNSVTDASAMKTDISMVVVHTLSSAAPIEHQRNGSDPETEKPAADVAHEDAAGGQFQHRNPAHAPAVTARQRTMRTYPVRAKMAMSTALDRNRTSPAHPQGLSSAAR